MDADEIAPLNRQLAQADASAIRDLWPVPSPEKWFAIPDWLPEPVSEMARSMYGYLAECGTKDDLELIERLATDPQMKSVWRELKKRSQHRGRDVSPYLYPGKPSAQALVWIGGTAGAEAHQAAAMAEMFRSIVVYALLGLPIRPDRYSPWQVHAGSLRKAASQLDGRRVASQRKRLLDAAAACQELASPPLACGECGEQPSSWNEKPDARKVTKWVAKEFQRLFGKSMYNTVASVVSVILGRTIERPAVREWLQK